MSADDGKVYGGPTKRFFVSMLTRDIELGDAILDLIDNCVDGAMRQRKGHLTEAAPFLGFHADITLSGGKFEITDNCGGIPADYVEDAFSLGRPNIFKDGDLPTIGMYGIGMKRAIFKIGDAATVTSNSEDGRFSVEYSREWMDPENEQWDLPIERGGARPGARGVTISIDDVRPEIALQLSNGAFRNDLHLRISEHFGYLMQRGFEVRINGEPVSPSTLQLFNADGAEGSDVRAFDFEVEKDGVKIKVTVGLFRGLAKETELDDETLRPTDQDRAGVSVICNDRVILLTDRTMKTGWGDGTVPRYHPQFRSIAGLMIFSSNDASKLPISTTKRDLDASSEIFLLARKEAMEGLKTFTNFTNKWKGMEEEAAPYFDPAKRVDVKRSISTAAVHGQTIRGLAGAKKFVPELPVPKDREERSRVSFVRSRADIDSVSEYLFGERGQHPSLVGSESFDRMLAAAKK